MYAINMPFSTIISSFLDVDIRQLLVVCFNAIFDVLTWKTPNTVELKHAFVCDGTLFCKIGTSNKI